MPTIQQILQSEEPASSFLCPIQANVYDLEFLQFVIRDVESNTMLFKMQKPKELLGCPIAENMRTAKYHFGPDFFKLKMVGAQFKFRIGNKPLKKLQLIEKMFFKKALVQTYQYQIPFCPPNCQNTFQAIYELPKLSQELIDDMIKSPYETQSDHYFFENGQLFMHNKSIYSYSPMNSGSQTKMKKKHPANVGAECSNEQQQQDS